MNDIAIKVENISKRYRIGVEEQKHDTLSGALTSWMKSPFTNYKRLRKLSTFKENQDEEDILWALKNISFEVKRGEVIGIIGRNGAGKSTLLKIISRITEPTSGKVTFNGRVSSLLEVGTGFHPELTGRENIYLNGTILGMKKAEIDLKFDEIVAFSEINKFLDTPVKRYSSGMVVRLAFSVAAHLEPEILLIDEVLAVGDVAFQKKCLGKMGEVAKKGRTVLFVSHNMSAINNLCQKGIVIEEGRIIFEGTTDESVRHYLQHLSGQNANKNNEGIITYPADYEKPIQITQTSLTDQSGRTVSEFEYHDCPVVNILFEIRKPNSEYYAIIFIQDIYGNVIFFTADDDFGESKLTTLNEGKYHYQIKLPERLLKPGKYYLTLSLTEQHAFGKPFDRRDLALSFEVTDNKTRRALKNGYRKQALVAPEIPWQLQSL